MQKSTIKVTGRIKEARLEVTERDSTSRLCVSFEEPYLMLKNLETGEQYKWWSEKVAYAHYDLNCLSFGVGDILTVTASVTNADTLQRVKVLAVDQTNHRGW